jgi:hypothetical protein
LNVRGPSAVSATVTSAPGSPLMRRLIARSDVEDIIDLIYYRPPPMLSFI